MSRANNDAHSAACKAAHEIFLSCVASIEARIAAGEISRDDSGYSDELSDAIHEEADSACIYTNDAWILAYGLRNEEDAIEQGLSSLASFDEVLTAQAYCNLRSALQGHDFGDAFKVAEDAALEKEGA